MPENNGLVTRKKTSGKTSGKILEMMQENDKVTIPEIAETLCKTTRYIKMHINKLKSEELLYRIGPAKGGHWRVKDE
ncbi:MAG: winged helix-turn-helix transcriptional regulator [Deltaproteobacteria bacterium]|nr:winged helix-turn-helix transcriptional regulator [Deltaproteobacteria bacterium]